MPQFLRHPWYRPSRLIILLAVLCLALVLSIVGVRAAHADSGPLTIPGHTCADTPSNRTCQGQDPVADRCEFDARTIESAPALLHGRGIGHVDLRYSPACMSYWTRTVAYANSSISQVKAYMDLAGSFNEPVPTNPDGTLGSNETGELISSSQRAADGSLTVYSDMAFDSHTPVGGEIDFSDGTPPVVVMLP